MSINETQYHTLTRRLKFEIEKAESSIKYYANRLLNEAPHNVMNAIANDGEGSMKSAAILELFKPMLVQIESDGFDFEAKKRAAIFTQHILEGTVRPSHWSGFLSNQTEACRLQAKARMVEILTEI